MIINLSNFGGGGGGGYVLPAATQSTLGGIKVGAGLDIDSGGTLSVSGGTGGGMAVYDYDVISGDSTARTELINLVSGGTQTAVVVREGIMYYYRGYDEDKYIFVDYKNLTLDENAGNCRWGAYRSVKVDSNGAEFGGYGQDLGTGIQAWMYTTSEYQKHFVGKNGFLFASDNTHDIIPGSTPVIGETYTNIYFTIPGMLWVINGLTVTVNGDSHEISWWGGKAWNVDGEVYGEDHTTEAGMTVDFSHIDGNGYGYIGISAAAMTVTQVPENGEGGGTSVVPPVLANYNLQMYRSGEWHSICGVPNLIFSGTSQGILASAVSTVKAGLYNGAYAGTDTFYILVGDLSQEAQSIVYTANTGVSETVTLKSTDYTAVIVRTISGDTYSLTLTKNPSLWIGTQAEYDAITAKSNTTLYVIVPAATGQPANEIWYTTDTGTTPLSQALQVAASGFNPTLGNSIVSDTIVNGVGKMVFTNPVTAIPDHAFFDGISGVLYDGYGDYTITLPEGVTSIGEAAFDEAVISGISLPSTLVEIGQWAFYGVWTADGSITFEGTSNQWNDDITFGENWMGGETNLCEIKCSDSITLDYCS